MGPLGTLRATVDRISDARRYVDTKSCDFVLVVRLLHQQYDATHLCFSYSVPRAGIGPIPYLRASPLEPQWTLSHLSHVRAASSHQLTEATIAQQMLQLTTGRVRSRVSACQNLQLQLQLRGPPWQQVAQSSAEASKLQAAMEASARGCQLALRLTNYPVVYPCAVQTRPATRP